jgi:hypothetical protein
MRYGVVDLRAWTCRSALIALIALGTAAATAGAPAQTTVSPAPGDYARADAQTIKTEVQRITSDPRFAPRRTFGQWLAQKLRNWDGPHLSPGARIFIVRVVAIWCLLTLVAILVHLSWTIWLLVRRGTSRTLPESSLDSEEYEGASFEQLWERSSELARAGAFRRATGVLLMALLWRLDALKVLSFHKSKTNGEYVREYPSRRAGRQEFLQFVALFERSIYGGRDVAQPAYDTMTTLAKQVLSHASQSAQV